ncbi:hypothetical protein MKW98_003758 [Papaver atlanticum]|uniref:Uncharacterized protein n=1 Tax=Papaver atlanticum TaxID=357466 RepID=A0AAD4T7Z5_9MAGN|nr:hypothetical protein MKW98_003758 [Papaver atlanticum]
MKTTSYVNLARLVSVLSLSSLLFLTVSAQTDETSSTVTGETNSTDVDIFSIYVAEGDPCLPVPHSWIKCSSDDTPRVTEINLHDSTLVGTDIPDFSAMDALEKIDLGANILLAAEFPDFLANFPKLKVLYLVGTSIYGTIPTSLKKRSDNKTLTLMLSGLDVCYSDEDVCPTKTVTGKGKGTPPAGTDEETSPGTDNETSQGKSEETSSTGTDEEKSATSLTSTPPKSGKKKTTPIVLGTLIPLFVIFTAIVGFLATRHQKRKATAAAGLMNGTMPMHGNTMSPNPLLPGMNLQDIENAAQNNFPDDQGANTNQHTHPTA